MSQPTGPLPEVEQEEPYVLPMPATVPVTVAGPVGVQHVPSRAWATRSLTVAAADPVRVAAADPRRRILRLVADVAIYVGVDQASVGQAVAASWPATTPLDLTHGLEVWVVGTDPEEGAAVSVVEELWAD